MLNRKTQIGRETQLTRIPCGKGSERASIMIETILALLLFIVVVFGLAQEYQVVLAKQNFEAIATEMILGPQERSLVYDTVADTFVALDSSTDPTLQEYTDVLGNFFLSRAESSEAVIGIKLSYLLVDDETGLITGIDNDASTLPVQTYPRLCQMNSFMVVLIIILNHK